MATLAVTLPDGNVVTKKTKVAYTYVIAAKHPEGKWFDARWCRTQQAALKAAGIIWPLYAKQIIPVA